MESFAKLKRRTTDLFQNIPQNFPQVPNIATTKKPKAKPGMKASWEKIDIPPLPLSSHSINVVNGSAFIFGGDAAPSGKVDNDMHVLVLPYNSAGADYYKVEAVPPKTYTPPPEDETREEPSVIPEASTETPAAPLAEAVVESKGKEKESTTSLDEVPLASPTTGADPSFDDDDDEEEPEITPTTSSSAKGKQPEGPPSPASLLPNVPGPRAGHATAVVGHRIFLFGGRDPESGQPINEYGRVWVYDTRSHAWTFLDPVPPAPGVTLSPMPGPRHGHAATSTDRPREFAARGPKRTQSWQQWAAGDSADVGIPQAPIVGNLALKARDEEDDGYGTFFIHGGLVSAASRSSTDTPTSPSPKRSSDLWAFDIHTRVWTELPAAPGPGRDGAAICISKSRLFRYGGSDGTVPLGGQLDFLHLEIETFDDGVAKGEVSVRARDGWQVIAAGATPESLAAEGKPAEVEIPLVGAQDWPSPRGFATLEAITNGAGREYLVLTGGEGADDEPTERGREGRTRALCADSWAFHVPPLGNTVASFGGAFWQAIGQPTGEGRWTRLDLVPEDEDEQGLPPGSRAWAATAPMGELEESGIVVWGGVGVTGRRLGDGWILRLA